MTALPAVASNGIADDAQLTNKTTVALLRKMLTLPEDQLNKKIGGMNVTVREHLLIALYFAVNVEVLLDVVDKGVINEDTVDDEGDDLEEELSSKSKR